MTEGNNPTDRSKLGTKRHILTDKKGIPLSIVITSAASIHDIKVVTDVLDNAVVLKPRPSESYFTKKKKERRCIIICVLIESTYKSKFIEQRR
jgi:hypothetical protein